MGSWDRHAARTAVASALLALAGGCGEPARCREAAPPGALRPLADNRFVAHAFGSPQGLVPEELYTESRAAFDVSYHNGFRVYEIDLVTLADGTVAAVHDQHEADYGLDRPFDQLTRGEVEGHAWKGMYPVLFGEDIIALMVAHPDVWMILDTKWAHEAIARTMVDLAPDDGVRDRLVPHVVSAAHATALPTIYPFPERMLARYQWDGTDAEIEANMRAHGLDDVMMWWDWRWNESIQAAMDAAGFHVWVHTPAEPDRIEAFADRGIGVYTDGYIPCGAGP
jgi:glycerophosphoryl diester phosphodiesterase